MSRSVKEQGGTAVILGSEEFKAILEFIGRYGKLKKNACVQPQEGFQTERRVGTGDGKSGNITENQCRIIA